jgi:hypothetical protein
MSTYNTRMGRFIVSKYEPFAQDGKIGMELKVMFAPNPLAWDALVALIQVVRCRKGDALANLNEDYYKTGCGPPDNIASPNFWHVDSKGTTRLLSALP